MGYRKDDYGQATSDHTDTYTDYSTQEYVEPEYISADHTKHHPTTTNDHTNKDFDWGYSLHNGPHVWSEYYPECEGYSQSPIVLPTAFDNHPFLKTIEYHNFDEFKAEYLKMENLSLCMLFLVVKIGHTSLEACLN